MMRSVSFLLLFSFLNILHASEEWLINDDHSEILFNVPYMTVTDINGRFTQFQGEAIFENSELASTQIQIRTDSIFTGNKIRDSHLKSTEFLNGKKNPYISFVSNKIFKKGKDYEIEGMLMLNGISKAITFKTSISPIVKDTWSYPNRFVKFEGTIKRHDFKISWDKSLQDNQYLVGEEIRLSGKFQLQPKGTFTPTHKFMIPDTPFTRQKDRLNRGEIQKVELQGQKDSNEVVAHPSSLKAASDKSEVIPHLNAPAATETKTLLWWISFLFLGLCGFIFIIGSSYWMKMKFADSLPSRYQEVGN